MQPSVNLDAKAPELNKLDIWFSNFGSWQGSTKAHSLSFVTEERRSQGPKGQTKWGSYLIPAPNLKSDHVQVFVLKIILKILKLIPKDTKKVHRNCLIVFNHGNCAC